jgi:hypothetical protein
MKLQSRFQKPKPARTGLISGKIILSSKSACIGSNFWEYQCCADMIFPGFAGTPAPPPRRVLCFFGLFLQNKLWKRRAAKPR